VDCPCVDQVAFLHRRLRQHRPETVALVTSLPPAELDAAQWLAANRAAWDIESSLHQRLHVSDRDDPCRVRWSKAMRRLGLFRRKQPQPVHGIAPPAKETAAPNDHRLFRSHERRAPS
jgi:hypothetical protein